MIVILALLVYPFYVLLTLSWLTWWQGEPSDCDVGICERIGEEDIKFSDCSAVPRGSQPGQWEVLEPKWPTRGTTYPGGIACISSPTNLSLSLTGYSLGKYGFSVNTVADPGGGLRLLSNSVSYSRRSDKCIFMATISDFQIRLTRLRDLTQHQASPISRRQVIIRQR